MHSWREHRAPISGPSCTRFTDGAHAEQFASFLRFDSLEWQGGVGSEPDKSQLIRLLVRSGACEHDPLVLASLPRNSRTLTVLAQ